MAGRLRPGFAGWLLLLTIALLLIAFQLWFMRDAEDARSWPAAEGRIVSSVLEQGCGNGGRQSLPKIVYTYRARGLPHEGHRIALDTDFCGWSKAGMEIVQAYPPGKDVTVYYNPRAPRESVLRQGAPQSPTVWSLLGCTALAMLCIVKLMSRVRPAEQKRRRR